MVFLELVEHGPLLGREQQLLRNGLAAELTGVTPATVEQPVTRRAIERHGTSPIQPSPLLLGVYYR